MAQGSRQDLHPVKAKGGPVDAVCGRYEPLGDDKISADQADTTGTE